MREGAEASGICGPSVEDPVPEELPLNLVLYMHLRIFAYSSNILKASFDPMVSMLASGTWKNLRFFRRSSSLRERDPAMKLICSTRQPWHCIVSSRALRRDAYWFSARDLVRMRYWSVISLILLNSRMQKMPAFDSVGGRNAHTHTHTVSTRLSVLLLSSSLPPTTPLRSPVVTPPHQVAPAQCHHSSVRLARTSPPSVGNLCT
jgi:hypothetical protein